ncbi:hypothetical protein PRIC2_012060 [Phytophthora ramorum]
MPDVQDRSGVDPKRYGYSPHSITRYDDASSFVEKGSHYTHALVVREIVGLWAGRRSEGTETAHRDGLGYLVGSFLRRGDINTDDLLKMPLNRFRRLSWLEWL